MSWNNQFQQASFMGVPFDCIVVNDDVNRRITDYEFPWKDGADLDDLGRKARKTTVEIRFFGDDYEAELGALIKVVDLGESGLFKHPILGEWTARASITDISHSAQSRDSATVRMEILQDGTSTKLPELFSINNLQEEVNTEATLITTYNTESYEEATDAYNSAIAFASNTQDRILTMESELNQTLKRCDEAITKAQEMTDLNRYPLVKALKRTAHSCRRLASRVQKTLPIIQENTTRAMMPLSLLMQKIYGNQNNSENVRKMNRIRNPFQVPAGTKLKIYG